MPSGDKQMEQIASTTYVTRAFVNAAVNRLIMIDSVFKKYTKINK